MSRPNPSPASIRADAVAGRVVGLRALAADGAPIDLSSATSRQEALAQLRAGSFAGPLEVDAVTYVQREAPNRNFTRFKDGIGALSSIAKSFKGQPVLLDHDHYSQTARIGTITSSTAERTAGGDTEFHQTLSIVKLSAIESVLDGTIDRFSIGWWPTGPIDCTVCKGPMFGPDSTCAHWPGDVVDGVRVQAVFTSAEGVEVLP